MAHPARAMRPIAAAVLAGLCLRRTGPGQGAEPVFGAPLPDRRGAVHQLHQGHRHQDQPHRYRRCRRDHAPEGRRRVQPGRCGAAGGCGALVQGGKRRLVPAGEVGDAAIAHSRQPARCRRWQWVAVVRLFHARACRRLRQGQGAARRCRHLRRTRRPEEQGQALHALGFAPVQPVVVRRRAAARRRPGHRGLAEGPGGQHGARAEGRRHRPDHGRGLG